MIKCKGSFKFPKYFLGVMTKDEIMKKFNPEQGENRSARRSNAIKGFVKDVENGNNLGSVIEIARRNSTHYVGDGGNRLFNDSVPGTTEFIVLLSIAETMNDVLFVINRLNNNRQHSKGYKAYTNESIRGLILPIANQFGIAGITLSKETGSRVTRSITYLQAARLILSCQIGVADDSEEVATSINKNELKKFISHMKVFNSASDLLDARVQPQFRGYPAMKGWASVMKKTPKDFSTSQLLPFLSLNGGKIEEIATAYPPRLQYVFWQYVAKKAIGCQDTKRESDILKNEITISQIKEVA
jgi:hypothetical protein